MSFKLCSANAAYDWEQTSGQELQDEHVWSKFSLQKLNFCVFPEKVSLQKLKTMDEVQSKE